MITDGELEQMRADQRALMFDTVTVERPGDPAWDEEAQATVTGYTEVYSGPGRVANPHGTPILSLSGELVTPSVALVTIPYGPSPEPGDRVRIIAPRPGLPEFVWVQAVETPGILATACRMACGAEQ